MARHRVIAFALGVAICASSCSSSQQMADITTTAAPCVASTSLALRCGVLPDVVAAAPASAAPVSAPPDTTPTTTTAEPSPTEPTDGECTVSDLLVPSCGAWLGASTAAKNGHHGTADYATGLDEYEAVAQNMPDILHFYKSGADRFPTKAEAAMAARPGHERSLLLYNWKPGAGLTWKQIASGRADHAIQTVATGLMAYEHKVFLTIWHEPEKDIGTDGSGDTPSDFVAMYRHVVTTLRELGVTNAVFVLDYVGYPKWSNVVDDLYPGDDVVDWIAYDPYGFDEHTDFGALLDTAKQPWPGFYTWATRKAPGKPIMLAEWGFDLSEATQAPAVLRTAPAIIRDRYPMLKALVYWNDDSGSFAVRIDQTTTLGKAYGQAYARFANAAYFNATSTAGAP
ncbi:MAG: hypothetical protein JWN99_2071 [Ilumatobacteraceae bacterium]|nr:hypothetical protein [Ilumatobacteraceae bacterium]